MKIGANRIRTGHTFVPKNIIKSGQLSGEFSGVSQGSIEPPFGLHLALRSTDDRLNGTPLSGYRTNKNSTMTHPSMLQQKIRSKTDLYDWQVWQSLSRTIENGRGLPKSGNGFKIFACTTIEWNPLQENSESATESCMKFLATTLHASLTILVHAWNYGCFVGNAEPEANISTRCSRRVSILCDDIALNTQKRCLIDHALQQSETRGLQEWRCKCHHSSMILTRQDTSNSRAKSVQSLERSQMGWILTDWLGCRSYQPYVIVIP